MKGKTALRFATGGMAVAMALTGCGRNPTQGEHKAAVASPSNVIVTTPQQAAAPAPEKQKGSETPWDGDLLSRNIFVIFCEYLNSGLNDANKLDSRAMSTKILPYLMPPDKVSPEYCALILNPPSGFPPLMVGSNLVCVMTTACDITTKDGKKRSFRMAWDMNVIREVHTNADGTTEELSHWYVLKKGDAIGFKKLGEVTETSSPDTSNSSTNNSIIPGAVLDGGFQKEIVEVISAERPKWGLFERGGYWRTVPAGPLEIFDIRVKWIPNGNSGVMEVRSRQRIFKDGKWDHLGSDADECQKLDLEKKDGAWHIANRYGDTTLDIMMIPKGIGAVAIQFGADGIFWKDSQGNTYLPGHAIPQTPTLAVIQEACRTPDPKRDELKTREK